MANGEIFIQNEVMSDCIEKMESTLSSLESEAMPTEKLQKSYGPSPYHARSCVQWVKKDGEELKELLCASIQFFQGSADAYRSADTQSAEKIQG